MIRILSDSTCDLPEALLKRYNVDVVPLQILLGDRNYEDGCGITPKDIFRWSDENKVTPKTAAVRQERVAEILNRNLQGDDEAICFAISESMSCTAGVMRMVPVFAAAGPMVMVMMFGRSHLVPSRFLF